MPPLKRPAFLALATIGCSFSGAPVTGALDASETDAAGSCVSECLGDDLITCPDSVPVFCPLGCDPDAAACRPLDPSNDAGAHAIDASSVVEMIISDDAVIYADTGAITGPNRTLRPEGIGIEDGIGYDQVNGYGVFVLDSLAIGPSVTVEVRGTMPLIILSNADVHLEGRLDVSAGLFDCGLLEERSCAGPGGGSGGDSDQIALGCAPGGPGAEGTLVGESGGGGGGAATAGSRGGDGFNATGGAGGVPDETDCTAERIVPLVGGSGGGRGGAGSVSGHAGGGGGGGAVQISSNTMIRIIGSEAEPAGILAGGAGGAAGGNGDGGGGGGAGGSILLEAPTVHLEHATLAANGGSGGGSDAGTAGVSGTFDAVPAPGGSAGTSGASGGDGGTELDPTVGGNGNDGGGGGAAAGRIRINHRGSFIEVGMVIVSPSQTEGVAGPLRSRTSVKRQRGKTRSPLEQERRPPSRASACSARHRGELNLSQSRCSRFLHEFAG